MLKIGHSVTVPRTMRGPNPEAEPETIAVPEELVTVPGVPQDPDTVNFYSRNYPIENHSVEHSAWNTWFFRNNSIAEAMEEHMTLDKPIVGASRTSGDLEPTSEPVSGKDVTREIKEKALELGFGAVGITAYDNRYTYKSKKKWVKPFPHAICLAMEQPYEETQMIPSETAEKGAFSTYRRGGTVALELADYIRSLGYHAQIQSFADASSAVIPMFVAAGMGQQGAMGYLLSPHFGSRVRLLLITTDAVVTYDEPVDYGIHAFCTICQVCVNRCPGRALMREKVWWRGVEKFKLIAKRCRPVMARYATCGICMKVCPVQRYGLKPVLEHYATTGQVLGKGTDNLEGYDLGQMGHFGPGELPKFDNEFFDNPQGTNEQQVLARFEAKIQAGEVPDGLEGNKSWDEFTSELEEAIKGPADSVAAEYGLDKGKVVF